MQKKGKSFPSKISTWPKAGKQLALLRNGEKSVEQT